jgi:hypothetical protein
MNDLEFFHGGKTLPALSLSDSQITMILVIWLSPLTSPCAVTPAAAAC